VELRHLRYFVAVAEELHVGRAAERLHIAQPALSRQVMALERELGVDLFDRSTGRMVLTPAGEAFRDETRIILQRVDRAVADVQALASGDAGMIEVGFVGPAMWSVLPAIMREHHRRHPGVHFRIAELPIGSQLEKLRDGSLDIGFLRPFVHDDLVAFETVWREGVVVVLPDNHYLAGEDAIDLAELKGEVFITIPRSDSPPLYDLFMDVCRGYGFLPTRTEEARSISSLSVLAAGFGVSLMPSSVADAHLPGIVARPLTHETPEIPLAVAYRRDRAAGPLAPFLETTRRVAAILAPKAPTTLSG
jgi:DNA-binding transcriptional LysR family regulator